MSGIISLAPFLDGSTLESLLEKLPEDEHINITALYPFLSQTARQKVAEKLLRK